MNFGTHKQQIIDLIKIALSKEKSDLIERFKIILNQCSSLFKSQRFYFWLRQLGSIPHNEIPITKFGLDNARRSIVFLADCPKGLAPGGRTHSVLVSSADTGTSCRSDRHSLENRIINICEQLFPYFHEDDICPFQ